MNAISTLRFSRRWMLAAGGAMVMAPSRLFPRAGASPVREFHLKPAPSRARLLGGHNLQTGVWAYNGTVPGPEIRVRQGDRIRLVVENGLAQETTVHWHGIRTPHAMDGVPYLTQKPIASGERFIYEFDAPDAGTYWYHPHHRSAEQLGRGLAGVLIVEEREPPQVDRDIVWVLDDWRLQRDASISPDFGNLMDMSHGGRMGNVATVNGQTRDAFRVRKGERLRLRLVNVANARIFSLDLAGHRPLVVAVDGQPCLPHVPRNGMIVLGPAMRADVILDMTGESGTRYAVTDRAYRGRSFRLLDLVYDPTPLRPQAPQEEVVLAPNTMPDPDLAKAQRYEISLGGGMIGGMRSGMMGGRMVDMRTMMRNGLGWTVNGIAATGTVMEPLLTLARGGSHVITLRNDTAWDHPMHLHGHSFRVIARNGRSTSRKEWQDTVLLGPRETADIAFVADNPGDWMFHCHILEHQAGGMSGLIRVA